MQQPPTEPSIQVGLQQLTDFSMTGKPDEPVMLIENLQTLPSLKCIQLNFIALLFCTRGGMELDMDDKHFCVEANDVLYCNQNSRLQHITFLPDYQGKLLCVSWNYAEELFLHRSCSWESILHTRQYPLLHLYIGEQQLLRAYYQLIAVKVKNRYGQTLSELDDIFHSFFRDFHRILIRHANADDLPVQLPVSVRRNELFVRFISLLKRHYKEEHFIAFYADHLCVSTKYLGMVVKQSSGESPSKWIDTYLMEHIRTLLRDSNLTINEIAFQLNFSNPSFFGKYVKAQTGQSPAGLRKSLRSV